LLLYRHNSHFPAAAEYSLINGLVVSLPEKKESEEHIFFVPYIYLLASGLIKKGRKFHRNKRQIMMMMMMVAANLK
jgi:hypothetical protein